MKKYFYVYVLQSNEDKNFYVGFTTNLPRRIEEHNTGKVTSTRKRLPLCLVYWEGCLHQADAVQMRKVFENSMG